LAQNELNHPIGWKWVEEFTDLAPPPPQRPNNNPPPPPTPAQDEQARMLKQQPISRPIPKL
jgi:hypothetical protein